MSSPTTLSGAAMSDLKSRLLLLYAEAGRRRVFRVVVVYLLVGFAALEGTSNLGSALGFPDSTETFVAVLLLVGFPIAVAIGWFYDFTAVGLVRTEALPPVKPAYWLRYKTSVSVHVWTVKASRISNPFSRGSAVIYLSLGTRKASFGWSALMTNSKYLSVDGPSSGFDLTMVLLMGKSDLELNTRVTS